MSEEESIRSSSGFGSCSSDRFDQDKSINDSNNINNNCKKELLDSSSKYENELNDWDPMIEAYYSPDNTLAVDDKNPVTFYTGKSLPSIYGSKRLCEHYMRYGSCADGNHCDRYHVTPKKRIQLLDIQLKVDEAQSHTRLNYSYLSPQPFRPDEKRLLMVTMTNIESPSLFHFVVPFENYDLSVIPEDEVDFFMTHAPTKSDVCRRLAKYSDMMERMFGKNYRNENINDIIYPSEIVASKESDGSFKRALVLEIPEYDDHLDAPQLFKLYQLDTGLEKLYKREDIYEIKAHCLSDPPMAVPATLGLKPRENKEWSEETLEYFKQLISEGGDQYLLCKIVEDRFDMRCPIEGHKVELFNIRTRVSLTERLIKNGFAERCPSY